MKNIIYYLLFIAICCSCLNKTEQYKKKNIQRADQTLKSLYKNYSVKGTYLLRETYPFKEDTYLNEYLASTDKSHIKQPNQYSYLWPYSGTFAAVNALYKATGDNKFKKLLEEKVLVGLEEYYDTFREPHAYSSYITQLQKSDRYYDDNIWIGIEFTNLYLLTQEEKYLNKALTLWEFIENGIDDNLGGGIYWCEQKKSSKNTCSNAPASVFALKLFQATEDNTYLEYGKRLYEWTQKTLQDSTDHLYFDRISLNGTISKGKYAYNSGQMMQASALLYQLTQEERYRKESGILAAACYNHFFSEYNNGKDHFRLLRNADNWFIAVMLRGYIEFYRIDKNPVYLIDIHKSMEYVWNEIRSENGLFEDKRFGGAISGNPTKWLLTQAAMIEIYANLSTIL